MHQSFLNDVVKSKERSKLQNSLISRSANNSVVMLERDHRKKEERELERKEEDKEVQERLQDIKMKEQEIEIN